MSYNFYSLVSSIKDKSSQAMATLSSDLKDFTAIIQEDVAEVSATVRKTVQEKSEALRQRADSAKPDQMPGDDATESTEDVSTEDGESKPRAASTASSSTAADESPATAASTINSLFSSIGGITLETSFGSLNFGDVGSKLLHTADELLGTLAGDHVAVDDDEDDADALAARRFRLLALQEDPETYVEPPLDAETFAKWKAATPSAELESVKADVLEHYSAVVDKFAELVPSVVDADAFWTHYIYKASLLAAQEQRGADLLEHALNDSEEEIGWGDVDSPRSDTDASTKSASNDTTTTTTTTAAFFPDDESKDDGDAPAKATPNKPDSLSSDGESWIELDERKAPLSSSSAASVTATSATAAIAATANVATDAAVVTASADDDGEEEEELDWGDDDIVPEGVLSGDEGSAAESAPAFHEEPKKRAGDWGEWD